MGSGATEEAKKEQLGAVAIKPPGWDRTGWEAFRYMIYDGENGTILTRFLRKVQTKRDITIENPLSWAKIEVKTQIQLELPERLSLG